MAKRNNERLDELCKMLSEKTGLNIQWAGSNGECCCVGDNPFNYLQGYHTKHDTILYMEGLLGGINFFRRQRGMTLREVRDRIAAFTGDKKREAMRKARIFAKHISLRYVSEIVSINYGYRTDDHDQRIEDLNWLELRWRDLDSDCDTFSIVE